MRVCFVTVGTTQFDSLIETLLTPAALELLFQQGFSCLRLQVGRGADPAVPSCTPISIEWYRFKDSLEADMRAASLLISHAGAGSILEALRIRSRLLVVVNDKLMHNHQQAA